MAKEPKAAAKPAEPSQEQEAHGGKGRPTPSRHERVEQNRRPLVPNDRKAAAKADRAKQAETRERARVGMAAGDERYLPERDRGPAKRFARDWVDARWSLGEAMLPIALVVVLLTFFQSGVLANFAVFATFGVYVYIIIALVDAVVMAQRLQRRVNDKLGSRSERVRFYAGMRAFYPRPLRLPKSKVKRGQFPA